MGLPHFVRGGSARARQGLFGPEISIPGTPDYIPRHELVPSVRIISMPALYIGREKRKENQSVGSKIGEVEVK